MATHAFGGHGCFAVTRGAFERAVLPKQGVLGMSVLGSFPAENCVAGLAGCRIVLRAVIRGFGLISILGVTTDASCCPRHTRIVGI